MITILVTEQTGEGTRWLEEIKMPGGAWGVTNKNKRQMDKDHGLASHVHDRMRPRKDENKEATNPRRFRTAGRNISQSGPSRSKPYMSKWLLLAIAFYMMLMVTTLAVFGLYWLTGKQSTILENVLEWLWWGVGLPFNIGMPLLILTLMIVFFIVTIKSCLHKSESTRSHSVPKHKKIKPK